MVLSGWSEQLCHKSWRINFGRRSVTICCICLKIKFVFDKLRQTNKTSSLIKLIIQDSPILMGNRYMTYVFGWENLIFSIFHSDLIISWQYDYLYNVVRNPKLLLKYIWKISQSKVTFHKQKQFWCFWGLPEKRGFFFSSPLNIWILIYR